MEEPTKEDIDRLIRSIDLASSSIGKFAKSAETERKTARETLKSALSGMKDRDRKTEQKIDSFERNIDRLTGALGGSVSNLRRMMTGFFGGAVVGAMLDRGAQLGRTFSEMNEYGQNFGGSMLKMHMAAAEAGIPLQDLAKIAKESGQLLSKMSLQDFGLLTRKIRDATQAHGMYGYTVEQLNEQVAEYATTSALYGTAHLLQSESSRKKLIDLAVSTSALSEVTKKSREEISKLANEAMRGALAIGTMNTLPAELRETTHRTLAEVTSVFAAQQGEAAKSLSKFVSDTFGAGYSALTETGKTINEAGLGQLLAPMDELAQKVRNNTATQEDAMRYSNEFKKTIEENSETLTLLASAGNAQAAQMLEQAGAMKYYNAEEMKQAKAAVKQRSAMSALMQSLEHRFGAIIGSLKLGFFKGIEKGLRNLDHVINTTDLDSFAMYAEKIGKFFGDLITRFANKETVEHLSHVFKDVWNGLGAIAQIAGTFAKILGPAVGALSWLTKALAVVSETVGEVAGAFGWVGDRIFGSGDKLQNAFTGIATALTFYFGPKVLGTVIKKFVQGFMMSDRTIIAKNVFVNGSPLGGGGAGPLGDLAGGGGSGGKGGKGWKGKLQGIGGKFKGKGGAILGGIAALAATSALFGGLLSSTGGEEKMPDLGGPSDDERKKARMAPIRVLNESMIADHQARLRFNDLMEQKLKLTNKERTEADEARLTSINNALSGMRQKYGKEIVDPKDLQDYALTGKVPASRRMKAIAQRTQAKKAAPQQKAKGGADDSWMDTASTALSVASLIPGLGTVAGLAGAGLEAYRGNWGSAGLFALSAIPGVGTGVRAASFGAKAAKAFKGANMLKKLKVGATAAGRNIGRNGMWSPASQMARSAMNVAPIAGIGSMFAWDMLAGEDEGSSPTPTNSSPTNDYTMPYGESEETKAIKRLIEVTEGQGAVMIQLMAQMKKLEERNSDKIMQINSTR